MGESAVRWDPGGLTAEAGRSHALSAAFRAAHDMRLLDRIRPLVARLSTVLGLVLLLGTIASGLHHHHGAIERGGCAVCSAGHASAVVVDAAPAPGALPDVEDLPYTAPEPAHFCSARIATSPRAPPQG